MSEVTLDLSLYADKETDPLWFHQPINILEQAVVSTQEKLDFVILNEEEVINRDRKAGIEHDRIVPLENELSCLKVAIDILKKLDKPIQLI